MSTTSLSCLSQNKRDNGDNNMGLLLDRFFIQPTYVKCKQAYQFSAWADVTFQSALRDAMLLFPTVLNEEGPLVTQVPSYPEAPWKPLK